MLTRRTALLGATLALPAQAQERFPSRPVTLIVPGAPGGGGDFTARLLAEGLAGPLGQSVPVENRTGGSGNVAASFVARAAPDGYTLLLAYSGTHVANPALFRELAWHPIRSFAPVALLLTAPHVLVIRPDLPARDMAELAAYIRRNPGRVTYASSGVASIQHLGGAMLAQALGTEMVHVPYRGAGPAMSDIIAGRVDMIITTPPAVMGQIQTGAVRAIVQTGRARHPMLPNLPTTAEAGLPGFELEAWFGIYAPAGTPREAVLRLSRDIQGVTETAEFRRKAQEAGTYVTFLGPEELAAFTATELTRWSGIIQGLGIRLD
ncbi:Bug family tripartite tricarboxylate transporter substrate binding protein [Sediminicoccus rosea]|jgi:tripartite-type tricarboxylate transporter receptor subunit TctC|uniref:Tripartite tricarboxylate transporter substrate binding protein n=1 Tax=Sediminicoccus rosea TaxID=1225128 RepID=A0ABZ0PGR4_9PROT|nr:tripartite tricarboxylate transporter substrate binding protein [Sediminicoccus rosea]WPB84471.1 tripartite tricarboxylate transporter substrate binding protein [Sediminicoccus rosea]